MEALQGRRSDVKWIAGLALAVLAGAGCAAVRPLAKDMVTVRVVFSDTGACPVDVVPVGLESSMTCGKPRCVRVQNRQPMTFQAWSARTKVDIGDDFALQFDPFKSAPLRSGNGKKIVTVDVDMPGQADGTEKHFTFNVLPVQASPAGCLPVDPEIIIVK